MLSSINEIKKKELSRILATSFLFSGEVDSVPAIEFAKWCNVSAERLMDLIITYTHESASKPQ